MNICDLNVVICYKNFAKFQGVSHVGLGISALNNCKVLNELGIRCKVLAVDDAKHLEATLLSLPLAPTHVIIQALWVPAHIMAAVMYRFQDTQFASVSHSNVGFLQVEHMAIQLLREYLNLERESTNFHMAGNCLRFCQSIEESFNEPCTYLPNMYWFHHKHGEPKRIWRDIGGTLKIGIFGASRVQKNLFTGVMACIQIASNLGAPVEIYINGGRDDFGNAAASNIRTSAHKLVCGLPNVKIVEVNWEPWTSFLKTMGNMNLLLQPTYSESFNIVTADGCAEGVPSVVSTAITWAPPSWKADTDDSNEIARTACGILNDPMSAAEGFNALKRHNTQSKFYWQQYLLHNKFGNV